MNGKEVDFLVIGPKKIVRHALDTKTALLGQRVKKK